MAGDKDTAAPGTARRLFVYNGGFLTQSRIKRILSLSGYDLRLGLPGPDDLVGVWGNSPTARRGEAVARQRGSGLVRVEDSWLRSLFAGRAGASPCGLNIDGSGVHYDPGIPSDLETLLATHPLKDPVLLARAEEGIARLMETHLTKYSAVDPTLAAPPAGYVLVIDQTMGDASLRACGAGRDQFLAMLAAARQDHPDAAVVIKSHPETVQGFRAGHFTDTDLGDGMTLCTQPISPWSLLEGAIAVYTVSSQLGFEAILAGHRPRVFGAPFYAGWGLTEDACRMERRKRRLTCTELFAAAVLIYPKWYDPFTDALCPFETALENLAAETRAWREDRRGWVASEMRLWKHAPLQRVFGTRKRMIFQNDPATARQHGRPWMVWAGKATRDHDAALRVEDGFLRSRGLGAELVPPLSLVMDDLGIYYDPARASRLEKLIAARETLRPGQEHRAKALIDRICTARLSKYNLGGQRPRLPDGHRILVAGQVEDDASLRCGAGDIGTNRALLETARQHNPDARIIYKPHPDVEAGLRDGGSEMAHLVDFTARNADPAELLKQVDEVWTMTSLLGFEALIRGLPVTTLGTPFYAGWGLTRDIFPAPERRSARPSITGLVHACLIDYPRYIHPDKNAPCPVEAIVDWLSQARQTPRTVPNRLLSKAQGLVASQARWWR